MKLTMHRPEEWREESKGHVQTVHDLDCLFDGHKLSNITSIRILADDLNGNVKVEITAYLTTLLVPLVKYSRD